MTRRLSVSLQINSRDPSEDVTFVLREIDDVVIIWRQMVESKSSFVGPSVWAVFVKWWVMCRWQKSLYIPNPRGGKYHFLRDSSSKINVVTLWRENFHCYRSNKTLLFIVRYKLNNVFKSKILKLRIKMCPVYSCKLKVMKGGSKILVYRLLSCNFHLDEGVSNISV